MRVFRIFYFALIMLFASCVREIYDPGKYSNTINSYPITLSSNLNAEDIKARFVFPDMITPWKDMIIFDHLEKSDTCLHKGYVRYSPSSDIFFFSSPSGCFVNKHPSMHSVIVSDFQEGKAQAPFYWACTKAADVSFKDNQIVCYANFKSFTTEVQIEIADSLDIVRLEIDGNNICGEEYLSVTEKDGVSISRVGGSFLSFENLSSSITVTKPSEKLRGNVIFNITPDSYDSASSKYYNSSSELSLTLVNGSKKVAETVIPLTAKLFEGETNRIVLPDDLKFINPKPTGRLIILQNDEELRISVADAPKGCRFFYETGTSKVYAPSLMSEEFDVDKGFRIQTTDSYTGMLVKVLVHDDSGVYSDLVLNGYVRNWNIVKGSALLNAYEEYKSKYSCDGISPGESVQADGLQAVAYSSAIGYLYPENSYSLLENTALLCNVENDGADCCCRYSTYGPAGSVISLIKENDVVSTWTVPSGTHPSGKPASAVYNEMTGLELGTAIAVRFSTNEALAKSFAILETGKKIIIPEPEKTKVYPVFKIDDSASEPTVLLDAEAIGSSLMNEVKFYYSFSTKSFEDAGTPTIYDAELTDQTKILANNVPTKHDELYMIILCSGPHHTETYTKLHFRTWHFGWSFEPTAKPASGTSYDFYKANQDYYGMTYSQPIGCVSSYGNRAQFKNDCTMTMHALLGGTVMMCTGCYKGDKVTSNNGISFSTETSELGAPNHPKIQWDINPSFMMFVSDSAVNVEYDASLFVRTGSKWYQFAPIACVEYLSE